MNRIIAYGLNARNELTKGADFLAECVKSTLGPYGENWYLDKKNTITNDGVSVAREIQLSHSTIMPDGKPANELNNRGASALREAAVKTVEEVGDGTTTAVILAQAIYHEAARSLSSDGVIGKLSPAEVRNKINSEKDFVIEKLKEMATPVDTEAKLIDSASVSMGDTVLGELIGSAQWKLGKEGIILPEESNDEKSSIEYVKGVCIDNGMGSGTLINNLEKQTMEVDKTKIVLTSYTIKTKDEFNKWIVPMAQKVSAMGGEELVVVARAWTEDTLQACLLNIQKGSVKIYPMNCPYMNMNQRMKDLSALTGATFFDCESTRLEDLLPADIGYAEKVVARRLDSVITGKNDKESAIRISSRIAELTLELGGATSEFEKKHISGRIAQLNNGFALLKVSAKSNMERTRVFDKCDDAVHAVRAAFQEGTVIGAGLAFKQIADTLPNDSILKRPLLAINQQIMLSAPKDFKVEEWVRDPIKVLRIALENACACAASFAMAGGVVTAETAKPLDSIFRKEVANANQE